MTLASPIVLMSVGDYLTTELKSEVRREYVGGYVYAMAESSVLHSRISSNCLGALFQQVRGGAFEAFNCATKIRLRLPTHTRFYYPDAMVVRESNALDETFQDRPVVIAEVISEATRRIDEWEKRESYLIIPSLMAYLVIETDQPRVVVHRRTDNGFVMEGYEGLSAVIPMPEIQAEVPLAELYERVDFSAIDRQ